MIMEPQTPEEIYSMEIAPLKEKGIYGAYLKALSDMIGQSVDEKTDIALRMSKFMEGNPQAKSSIINVINRAEQMVQPLINKGFNGGAPQMKTKKLSPSVKDSMEGYFKKEPEGLTWLKNILGGLEI